MKTEDEVDAIRDNIYNIIKDMPSSERTAYFNAIAEKARNEYGFCVIKSAIEVSDQRSEIHDQ